MIHKKMDWILICGQTQMEKELNLYFNGINILGVYDHNESYHLFIECLQKLVYVKRILENCTYEKIICSESLKDFFKTIPEISNNSI